MRQLAIARDYAGLLELLRQRVDELRLSCNTIDAAAGLADGYTTKLLCGLRRYGPVSLGLTLQALGVELVLREADDPAAIKRLERLPKRVEGCVRRR